MKNRADDIRRRYQARMPQNKTNFNYPSTPNRKLPNQGKNEEENHSLSGGFLMRIMFAICLFLLVGVLFKSQASELDVARKFVKNSFEKEFQFAHMSAWYEERFGTPFALIPSKKEKSVKDESEDIKAAYALPVTVTQSFEDNGKGIMLETGSKSDVVALNAGKVTFIGEKENFGKTIIIQHSDLTETWYGKLDSINKDIKIYDVVEKGAIIGKVSESGDNTGQFYFAIKKGDSFIDPLKVVNFD